MAISGYSFQAAGALVVHHVIALAKERGFDGIRLVANEKNPAAIALYEKTGFIRCGETVIHAMPNYCFELAFG